MRLISKRPNYRPSLEHLDSQIGFWMLCASMCNFFCTQDAPQRRKEKAKEKDKLKLPKICKRPQILLRGILGNSGRFSNVQICCEQRIAKSILEDRQEL